MALKNSQLAAVMVVVGVVAVPLIYAQGGTSGSGQGTYGSGSQGSGYQGSGMYGQMSGAGSIAVDDRFVYVLMNNNIARIDKSSGQLRGTMALFGGDTSGSGTSTMRWDSRGTMRNLNSWNGNGMSNGSGLGTGSTSGGSGSTSGSGGSTSGGSTSGGTTSGGGGSTSGGSTSGGGGSTSGGSTSGGGGSSSGGGGTTGG